MRADDVVARLGGDEFVVVCRGADSDLIAVEIGERIIDRVGGAVAIDDIKVSVGVSIGIAVHHSGETTAAEMIRRADAALYEAKRSGRGRIAFDPGSTGSAGRQTATGLRRNVTGRVWSIAGFGVDAPSMVADRAARRGRRRTRGRGRRAAGR